MTISIGQIGTFGQINGAATTTFSTAATASATTTGSGFIVAAAFAGNLTVTSVTDTFSNTYTHLTRIYDAGTNFGLERWYCANGTGGASHQANIVMSGAATVFAALIEAKNAATSGFYVATNDTAYQYSSASPYSTSLAVSPPATGALLLSCFVTGVNGSAVSPTLTESSGFTIIGQENLDTGGYVPALAYYVISSSATYTPSWTAASPAGSSALVSLDSFFGPSGNTPSVSSLSFQNLGPG
jgi:hypothetical protein